MEESVTAVTNVTDGLTITGEVGPVRVHVAADSDLSHLARLAHQVKELTDRADIVTARWTGWDDAR
jgi:hypothetical protein